MLEIFIVDDERILRVSLADDLRDAGHNVLEFADAGAALQKLRTHNPDVIITDLKMPHMDGIGFLKKAREINPDITVVMMTAYATFPTAVEAIKLGAYDFLVKPFQSEVILLMLERIKELQRIKKDHALFRNHVLNDYDFTSFIGSSDEVRKIKELVKMVADSGSNVLIVGETGTGKELLTNIIHYNSNRRNRPLIKVSCAVLAKEVIESELFGHTKGAFTGAEKDKKGRFELADGGALYLDDVDDIPLELQVKLLRAIEEREIERVGGTETKKVDVRIIASTKTDLKKLAAEGKFREDLYYRLNVFPINLNPLRERKKDIPDLFDYFLSRFSGNKKFLVDKDVYSLLIKYHWPGNIRELKNIAERLSILATDGTIKPQMLPPEIQFGQVTIPLDGLSGKSLSEALSDYERNAIHHALFKYAGNKSKAAEFLGIPLSTLRTKMEKYNIH